MKSAPVWIFPIHSKPYGYTYGEWSAKWWQWLLSIPKPSNPALDSTGTNAAINQNYSNVFFLCQTYELTELNPNRIIIVPSSRCIFMPIINWVSILDKDGETDDELLYIAKKKMDAVARLEVTINGITLKKGLEKYRAQSPFFNVTLPEENILESPAGHTRLVSDGYWIFLGPLESATELITFGSCSSGVNKFGVNYHVNIV